MYVSVNHTLRVMRLTAFLLTVCCLGVSAGTLSQSNITYSGTDVKLETVFQAVRKQTGYFFVYDNALIAKAKPVTIDAKNIPLEEFMDLALKDQELMWLLQKTTILIQKKKTESKKTDTDQKKITPVKGTVRGPDGQPIANVNVVIKGTKKGTTTKGDGTFSIDANTGDVLIFSSVGFGSKEIKISNTYHIYLALEKSTSMLDEVQIIAYGQTSRRFSVGNISTVKAEEIEKQPVSNPLLAMQGRVPGVVITQSTGFPGSGVTVRIQGVNSIGSGNDPLYVIDGVPYTAQLLPSISTTLGTSGGRLVDDRYATYGSPLSFINPADIESIQVLKDADATAIYGSRAANGAILITTKKGKAGDQKIQFNIQQGWGQIAGKMDLLDRRQYLDMRYEALKNDGIDLNTGSPTDPAFYDLKVWDTTSSNDWQKELIGNTSHYTDLQANISGGNTNTFFTIGSRYHHETTVMPGDFNDQKASVHFSINSTSANRKFNVSMVGNYMMDINKLPHNVAGDLTTLAMQLPPIAPELYNADGSINWAPDANGKSTWDYPGNPAAQLLNTYHNETKNLISNLNLNYEVLEGLSIKSSFGYTDLQADEKVKVPLTSTAPELRNNTTRIGIYGNNNIRSWLIEPQITYDRRIGYGNLQLLLGGTIQENKSEGTRIYGFDYTTDQAIEDISSAGRIESEPSIDYTYKYCAIFGRINYQLRDKYIANINVRRDGSSRFGAENQFHYFGSVGGAWIFSEEPFIKEKFRLLSFGKIRASYGTTGNDQIPDYQYLSLFRPATAGVPYQGINTIFSYNLPNPYLQWEETKKLNVGLDIGILNDKLLANVNYYLNRSSNQLLGYQLPITTGVGSITQNFPATVQNSGWEFTLSYTNSPSSNVKWTSGFNLTIPSNKLVSFPGIETSTYANYLIVGEPITIQKKFHLVGVDPLKGSYYFFSKTNAAKPKFPDDASVIIDPAPELFAGFQNSITFKNFQLDVLFQYAKQRGQDYFYGRFPGAPRLNQPVYVLDRWQAPGDVATHQRFNSNFSVSSQWSDATSSDASHGDATFIRMKNISLSWTLPENLLTRIRLQGVRIYMLGQNLFTISNYKSLDPETLSAYSLPPLRVLTIGLQVDI